LEINGTLKNVLIRKTSSIAAHVNKKEKKGVEIDSAATTGGQRKLIYSSTYLGLR